MENFLSLAFVKKPVHWTPMNLLLSEALDALTVMIVNHVNRKLLNQTLYKKGLVCLLEELRKILYAWVNSSCAPPPPRADPRALAFFWPWMANSRGWGLLSCQIPRGGDEKRGQMSRPPSTLQHFLLIARSSSAILSILMCDFLFQLTSFFVIVLF